MILLTALLILKIYQFWLYWFIICLLCRFIYQIKIWLI